MNALRLFGFGFGATLLSTAVLSCSSKPAGLATNAALRQPVAVASRPTDTTRSQQVVGADLPIITCLERRNQTITIKAGPNGVVYAVTDRQGKVLHHNLSERELQAKVPHLYQFIKTAVGSDGRLKANDASLGVGATLLRK